MPRRAATVWPNGQAREQAQSRVAAQAPGGLVLGQGETYTFRGTNPLLPALWASLPAGHGDAQPLAELAGPLLVQHIVAELGRELPSLAGLSRGRRFPHRLWRLLVGLKAAGLTPQHIESLPGPGASRRHTLAQVFTAYLERMHRAGLADEADQIDAVVGHLDTGKSLPLMEQWSGLRVRQALWLRPSELRLLRALSSRVPVEVEFALVPPRTDAGGGVHRLLVKTADALERGGHDIEVTWRDLQGEGGPLAELALAVGRSEAGPLPKSQGLELVRAPGVYAECEALVARARGLVDSGVPAHEVLLVFPDLSLHGQMAGDVAARLGLPLSFRRPEPLAGTPLAQAFIGLLSLPQQGYPRVELARVWDSPYLGPALASVLQEPHPQGAARLLSQAAYVDARETPTRDWLRDARNRVPARNQSRLQDLARACGALAAWLAPLDRAQGLAEYAERLRRMLSRLNLASHLAPTGNGQSAAQVTARDLNSASGLERAVAGLGQAADQINSGQAHTPGRLLAMLRQALEQQDAGRVADARGGVRVLRLEDAQGLEPAYLLAGGLNLEEFPARPSDLRLLSGPERIALGRAAGLPVWRTEEEEFGGQVLRLLLLMGSARQGATLSCAAADMSGAPRSPSLLLSQLAKGLDREADLATPAGGVYGETPPLDQCAEERSLWASLSRAALRPHKSEPVEAALAQGALHQLARDQATADRWRSLAGRAMVEQNRLRLETLGLEARRALAGPCNGLLLSDQAQELLRAVLASPKRRRMSPSSLEGYAACPMAWFLQKILGLAEEDEPAWELAASAEGEWVHAALARFFAPKEFDPAWDAEQQAARLQACLEQARQELAAKGSAGHSLVQSARRGVLLTSLGQVVAAEMADMGDRRPRRVEAEFGREDSGLEIAVADGEPLGLHGRLDRLDTGPGQLRVVDYKHSSRATAAQDPLRENELAVGAFQVPVYLAAARRFWGSPDDALSARLVPTRRRERGPAVLALEPGDPLLIEDPAQRRDLAARGQANLFNAVAGLWERISTGDFLATPENALCEYCSLAGVCRARLDPAASLEDAP